MDDGIEGFLAAALAGENGTDRWEDGLGFDIRDFEAKMEYGQFLRC